MKPFINIFLFLLITSCLYAQGQLKIPLPKANKVVIYSDSPFIDAEGYDGDKILVSPQKPFGDTLLNLPLLADNNFSGDTLITYQSQLKTGANNFIFNNIKIISNCRSIKILVPNNLSQLDFEFKTMSSDGLIRVKNYKGPLQIAAYLSPVEVEAVTGPFWIFNEYGKVSLKHILWSDTARWTLYDHPYMVRSSSSDIDISVPPGLNGYFSVFIDKGKAYSNLGLKPGLIMNAGGIGISVKSNKGNIFLKRENN